MGDDKKIAAKIIWLSGNETGYELGTVIVEAVEREINWLIRRKIASLLAKEWSGFGDDNDRIRIEYINEEE